MLIVGSKVKTIGFYKGITGTVINIVPGVSVEDHGSIDIRIDSISRPKFWKFAKPGDIEDFVHFNWQKSLKVIY